MSEQALDNTMDLTDEERDALNAAPDQPTDDAEEFFDNEIHEKLRALHLDAAKKGIRMFSVAHVSTEGTLALQATMGKSPFGLPFHALLGFIISEGGHPRQQEMVRAAVGASGDPLLVESFMDAVLTQFGIDIEGKTPQQKAQHLAMLAEAMEKRSNEKPN